METLRALPVDGGRYKAERVPNTDRVVIRGVPIFGALKQWERSNPFDVGEEWMDRALDRNARQIAAQNAPPLHVNHHGDGAEVEDAGTWVAVGRSKVSDLEGTPQPVMIADFYTTAQVARDIQRNRIKYVSAEVDPDWETPHIRSVSLLIHEPPHFDYLPILSLDETAEQFRGRGRYVTFAYDGGSAMDDKTAKKKDDREEVVEEFADGGDMDMPDADPPIEGDGGMPMPAPEENMEVDATPADVPPWGQALVQMIVQAIQGGGGMAPAPVEAGAFGGVSESITDGVEVDEFGKKGKPQKMAGGDAAKFRAMEARLQKMQAELAKRDELEKFRADVAAAEETLVNVLGGIDEHHRQTIREAREAGKKTLDAVVNTFTSHALNFSGSGQAPNRFAGAGVAAHMHGVPEEIAKFAATKPELFKRLKAAHGDYKAMQQRGTSLTWEQFLASRNIQIPA